MRRSLSLLAALAVPLARSDDDRRASPDLELLVSGDAAWSVVGGSTRSGLGSRKGGDTGVEPAFDESGAGYTGGGAGGRGMAAPQLIDDFDDSPPPSPAASSPSSAPLTPSSQRHAMVRFGVLPGPDGFDEVDFWQRLADLLKGRTRPTAPPRARPRLSLPARHRPKHPPVQRSSPYP